jgi:hypothetical protein
MSCFGKRCKEYSGVNSKHWPRTFHTFSQTRRHRLLSLGISRLSVDGIISISYEHEYQHYTIVKVWGIGLRYNIKGIKN